MQLRILCLAAVAGLFVTACDRPGKGGDDASTASIANPFPSTYTPYPSQTLLITNATVIDGAGGLIEKGSVLIEDGRIKGVGTDLKAPTGAATIDAAGKWVTPGISDHHSHLGAYPSPGVDSHGDGNEISGPVTAEVWVEHSVWPQDPGFTRALAGGITSLQILPGSANLFGGRGVTLKNVPARSVQAMKFPGAPYTLKMACGENPKRVYGYGNASTPGGAPYSRMGNVAGYRDAWIKATEYKKDWDRFNAGGGTEPKRDLELETLAGVLNGEILVHMHCYRADEMAQIIDI
jgi:imidazolonepropionase-like amidohydrolase